MIFDVTILIFLAFFSNKAFFNEGIYILLKQFYCILKLQCNIKHNFYMQWEKKSLYDLLHCYFALLWWWSGIQTKYLQGMSIVCHKFFTCLK